MKSNVAAFLESFRAINQFLASHDIRYCLVGGLAVGYWGEPRDTPDMDFTVAVKEENIDSLLQLLKSNEFKFAIHGKKQIRVTQKGRLRFAADLILCANKYHELVISRAIPVNIFNMIVPICTAEDLILLKGLSPRRQDLLDAEGILKKRADELDQNYLATGFATGRSKKSLTKDLKLFFGEMLSRKKKRKDKSPF